MIAELGFFALCLSLAASIGTIVTGTLAVTTRQQYLTALVFPLSRMMFVGALASYVVLSYCFYANDFSVEYVANHSNSLLPWYYRLTAVWGSHEGSLLLWVMIQTAWIFVVSVFSKTLPLESRVRLLTVLAAVAAGFLAFTIFASNPFERSFPFVPQNGADLNPLLQDFGMIVHPPLLYMGYVGLSVAYSLAVVALIEGRVDSQWARWTRNWTMIAWSFLTAGIALGSWWAYYELGWGGWWFWDPVENASFMPWLVATALIHSLIVSEKRGAFQQWTILLSLTAFSLSLLGTFLVRSGVITSVHAFASDPERGLFILQFLGMCIGGSLALFAWRAPQLRSLTGYTPLSREALLLVNNLILILAMVIVLFGTLYPLIHDALGMGKVSVGPPYFNLFFVPLMLILGLFMVAGPLANWKQTKSDRMRALVMMPYAVGAVAGVVIAVLYTPWVGVAAGIFVALIAVLFVDTKRKLANRGLSLQSLSRLGVGYWAMHLAHIAFGLCLTAVAITVEYSYETAVRLAPGETKSVQEYSVKLDTVGDLAGSNWVSKQGHVLMSKGDSLVADLYPEKRNYTTRGQIMTEAAIDWGFTRDLYVALGEQFDDGSWSLRVQIKPGVRLIWIAGALMSIAGLMSIYARRRRK